METEEYDFLFKFILIGNSPVGKSSFLYRYSENKFRQEYQATIGVEFSIKAIAIQEKTVKLQIWDTSGQECYKAITAAYYRGAHGIILIYDITNRQSFKDIENWLTDVKKYVNENVVTLLVGNKSDLEEQRQVSQDEGQQMAKTLGVQFLEVSAKTGFNVEKVFITVAEDILERIQKQYDAMIIEKNKECKN